LFCDDKELHRRVAAHLGEDRWAAVLKEWEKSPDFPKFYALLRGRFYPAVRQWLDDHYGAGSNATARVEPDEDGQEHFDAPPKKPARVQARAAPAPVLDGQSDTRPEGTSRLPRTLRPIAGGRN
jgi:hypothetical protein